MCKNTDMLMMDKPNYISQYRQFKGLVHFQISWSFTHPHVILDVYIFLSLVEKKRDLFNIITYYVKSGTRVAEQARICVYKAYTFILFF